MGRSVGHTPPMGSRGCRGWAGHKGQRAPRCRVAAGSRSPVLFSAPTRSLEPPEWIPRVNHALGSVKSTTGPELQPPGVGAIGTDGNAWCQSLASGATCLC